MVSAYPRILVASFLLALLAACSSAPRVAPPSPPPPRDAVTAAALERVLAGEHRSAEHRSRDEYRYPLETLLFFGIKPGMTVAEAWPDADGWYTELLAPLLAGGKLFAAMPPPVPGDGYMTTQLRAFSDRLAARADLYGTVEMTSLGPGDFRVAPPESCDMVVTFDSLHNWMNLGFASEALAAMHRALKPGGILGVVEHRADPAKPPDPLARRGYVNEDYAIRIFEDAGFELVARSEINANPKDTKDYPQGVWTLPPNYRLGERDRAKYAAIGEGDRFTLRFKKR